MHIAAVVAKLFRRFTHLEIKDIPPTARLVVLVGPNGCGKSSVFDLFRAWHIGHGGAGIAEDKTYYNKHDLTPVAPLEIPKSYDVQIEFHESIYSKPAQLTKKAFYMRTAYRNEAAFSISELRKKREILDAPKVARFIDDDRIVKDNYERLVSITVADIFSGERDQLTVEQLRDRLLSEIRASLRRVFPDLVFQGLGSPFDGGTFLFEKGNSRGFNYKNLSAGEKSVFDLILDLVLKRVTYDDSIYCIDEPESHLNARIQSQLLTELFNLTPPNSQLWIATHSIGMMRNAAELKKRSPNEVVFLDFFNKEFDDDVTITPSRVDRAFWKEALNVTLDDLAELIAPKRVILCEGSGVGKKRNAFDASCLSTIFNDEYLDIDFVSSGNADDVQGDKLAVGRSIQTILPGTEIIRLIDRDARTTREITELTKSGVRVLSRRHLESYLLDDEILTKLCSSQGKADLIKDILEAKMKALHESHNRGNPSDDLKSAAGEIYLGCSRILDLRSHGNDATAFMRDIMAPLIVQGTETYSTLETDIFG